MYLNNPSTTTIQHYFLYTDCAQLTENFVSCPATLAWFWGDIRTDVSITGEFMTLILSQKLNGAKVFPFIQLYYIQGCSIWHNRRDQIMFQTFFWHVWWQKCETLPKLGQTWPVQIEAASSIQQAFSVRYTQPAVVRIIILIKHWNSQIESTSGKRNPQLTRAALQCGLMLTLKLLVMTHQHGAVPCILYK